MADIEQTQQMIPLVTCEIPLLRMSGKLVFGVDVLDLDFWVQVNSIEQSIKRNSVGPSNHLWDNIFSYTGGMSMGLDVACMTRSDQFVKQILIDDDLSTWNERSSFWMNDHSSRKSKILHQATDQIYHNTVRDLFNHFS